MIVRQAKAEDLEAVAEISRTAYGPAYLPVIGALPRPAIEDYRPWIAKGRVWLCKVEARPVGVLVMEPHSEAWMVWSVAVAPPAQGRGLGLMLLRYAEEVARQAGVLRLRLHTNTRIVGNIAVYEQAGFQVTRVVAHPSRSGHSLAYMEKDLV
ncbi:GNAT family N-acetyltransferase [Gymnodinialimonas sp. 2305UL16-5]|uniref:GNAT family N-acetyltransferase n=1 Tax=Gymnodinialimonas mytili TaxID=3126503 RepID=UPI003096D26E